MPTGSGQQSGVGRDGPSGGGGGSWPIGTHTGNMSAVFPLLSDAAAYRAEQTFTFDYSKPADVADGGTVTLGTWLEVFRASVPGFKHHAATQLGDGVCPLAAAPPAPRSDQTSPTFRLVGRRRRRANSVPHCLTLASQIHTLAKSSPQSHRYTVGQSCLLTSAVIPAGDLLFDAARSIHCSCPPACTCCEWGTAQEKSP